MKLSEGRAVGFIKMGEKDLYYHSLNSEFRQIRPTCVLDFFVIESHRRKGYGREIFEYMLKREGQQASNLGYDKPSQMFLNFLAKNY